LAAGLVLVLLLAAVFAVYFGSAEFSRGQVVYLLS
jgi:hypothetical protein